MEGQVWALGAGSDVINTSVRPSAGLGCSEPAWISTHSTTGAWNGTRPVNPTADIEVVQNCTPVTPGSYTFWMNVTDALNKTASAEFLIEIVPDPKVVAIVATQSILVGVSSADVGETVTFSAILRGGTGWDLGANWSGLNATGCAQNNSLTNETVTCLLSQVQNLSITVRVDTYDALYVNSTDIGIWTPWSTPFEFSVWADPVASVPAAAPTSADVGQPVNFTETASKGSGNFTVYRWSGLPISDCLQIDSSHPTCVFRSEGIYPISVSVEDSNLEISAMSATLRVQIYSALAIDPISVNRTMVDVGQSVQFSSGASGGRGPYSFVWSGLPTGCPSNDSANVTCVPAQAGSTEVSAVVVDGNGAHSQPAPAIGLVVSSDPTVGPLHSNSLRIIVGQPLILNLTVTGGTGNYTYSWKGLPYPCTSANGTITCSPQAIGTFNIFVVVTDSNGFVVTSNEVGIAVTASSSGPFFPWEVEVALGIAAVAAVYAVVTLVRRSRRPK